MKIAIIGTGRVGTALATRIVNAGHDVVFGSRQPSEAAVGELSQRLGDFRVTAPREAAAWAEIVVLAVPWTAVRETVESLGDLGGKIVIDVTNPLAPGPSDSRAPADYGVTSGAAAIAQWVPGASVVKAFNTTGAANLANPDFHGQQVPALLCGEPEATAIVAALARSMGFEPIVVGGIDRAHLAEAAAALWITLAYQQGQGPDFAFVVARRSGDADRLPGSPRSR